MRVGVYVGDRSPEAGGGFTIVNEILGALQAKQFSSRHEFVALSTASGVGERTSSGMPVISLREVMPGSPIVNRIDAKLRRSYARALGHDYSPRGTIQPNPAVDALLTDRQIDVIWYLSVWDRVTLEIPFITVVWDLQHRLQPFFPEVSDDGKWDYREQWLSTALQRAALVIAGTQAGRDEIERFYGVPATRVRIIPHPTPTLVERWSRSSEGPGVAGDYIFYPAQLWPHKNHANLLAALRQLRGEGADLSLALSGSDQGNGDHIRKLVSEWGLGAAVHLLGFVSESQLVALYRHAVALTYVTFFGPENLPPLEAFAAGCPVIASDVSGAREQLGEAALLVDPTRPDQIAAAVKAVRSDAALRARLIEAGRARVARSTPASFVRSVVEWLDGFETTRRCWPSGVYQAGKRSWP